MSWLETTRERRRRRSLSMKYETRKSAKRVRAMTGPVETSWSQMERKRPMTTPASAIRVENTVMSSMRRDQKEAVAAGRMRRPVQRMMPTRRMASEMVTPRATRRPN